MSTTSRKGKSAAQPTYAWVIKLNDSSTVARTRVEPSLRGTGRPVYHARCGNLFDYTTINRADLFDTKSSAAFYAGSFEALDERVVKVRVAIEEVEVASDPTQIAAELRVQCNGMTATQRKKAYAHGMTLIRKGAKREKGRAGK